MLIVITSPTATSEEMQYYAHLFEVGLQCLHLRLLGRSRSEYEDALLTIHPRYRDRVVLCDHFELAEQYGVGGIHLRQSRRHEYQRWHRSGLRVSTSAHSIEELQSLPFAPTYALLGPVYDSISKEGYTASLDTAHCRSELPLLPFPVIALGGITPERMTEVMACGFAGGAVLGYISGAGRYMEEAYRRFDLPEILSIAGHDPSSGAGLVADALTITQAGGHPLTVTTALTVQDAEVFEELIALSGTDIRAPLGGLLARNHIPLAAKIGLVTSLDTVLMIARRLKNAGVRYVVWDPVLAPTASREPCPLYQLQPTKVKEILSLITLITPNYPEARALFGTTDTSILRQIAMDSGAAILLKGGHTDSALSTDVLLTPDATTAASVPRTHGDKHGTGCQLSAHIAARLGQGFPLEIACRMGQWRVDEYRRSAAGRMGQMLYDMSETKEQKLRYNTLQFITDNTDTNALLATCRAVLEGGVRWIQLRMKHATHDERVATARTLKALMTPYVGSTLIIDDDIDAVLESDADGVHLGLSDASPVEARRLLGTGKIIGGTCNTTDHLRQRALEGVDYVGVGPYRHTITKSNLSPLLGAEGMRALVAYNRQLPHPIPMVGIGGIVPDDLPALARIGLRGVALSGVINRADDIEQTAKYIQEASDHYFL